MTRLYAVLVTICLLWLSTGLAQSHPFHTSVAELDWNAQAKRWEVSLRVHSGDLESALTRLAGKNIDIESPQTEELIQRYLVSRFQFIAQSEADKMKASIKSPDKQLLMETKSTQKLDWVGSELEGNWMWLYFELSPPESSEQLVLVSQLLTEINDDQINILSVRRSGKRVTRQTNREQLWINLQ